MTHGRDTPCDAHGEECPLRSAVQQRALTTTHAHVRASGETTLFQVVAMPVEGGGALELHIDLGGGVALDPLTGLYRREFWMEIAERERDLLMRLRQPYGVIFVDIDRFKTFNDRWGHSVGDQALVELATALRAAIRGSDTAGRWGGDELVAFLPHTDPGGLAAVAERVRALAHARVVHTPDGDQRFTVSAGVRWARWDEPLADAVNAADRAMYQAKTQGRDRIVVSREAPVLEAAP